MADFQLDSMGMAQSVERYLRPWLEAKVDSVATLAMHTCPVGEPDPLGRPREWPKHMRDEHSSTVEGSGLNLVGRVTVATPYALSVHEGSRPHEIVPRGSGYPLRFVKAGKVVRTRKVNHPGYSGNPWLRRALIHVISASPG